MSSSAPGVERRRASDDALVRGTYAMVLAGGRGARLGALTAQRAKPAMPFGGKLKIIDFTLSNCVNSGLRRIAVLTQYRSQGMVRHVSRGWGFLDAGLGEGVEVVPAQQKTGEGWYRGTADAVYQNLDLLREARPQCVLVLAGDHVYKMDYRRLLADHARHHADLTMACIDVPIAEASAFGVLRVDDAQRVLDFAEKPARPWALPGWPDRALASMGVYAFDAAFLAQALREDALDVQSQHDFGHDLIPRVLARSRVVAHRFDDSCVNGCGAEPYWRDVGTLDAYWEANLDLTRSDPALNLYDAAWPIRTLEHPLPPARFVHDEDGRRGMAVDSLVAGGCIVDGATVRRSLLFSKVQVGEGSVIEDTLLLPDVVVGRGVQLRRAIIDKHCRLPDGLRVGLDPAVDRDRFTVTPRGVTLVTPDMLVRAGLTPAA